MMIKLIKIANKLDSLGYFKEADLVDSILRKLAKTYLFKSAAKKTEKEIIELYKKLKMTADPQWGAAKNEQDIAEKKMKRLEKQYPDIDFEVKSKKLEHTQSYSEDLRDVPEDIVSWFVKTVEQEGLGVASTKRDILNYIAMGDLKSVSDLNKFVKDTMEGQELYYTEPELYSKIKENLELYENINQDELEDRFISKIKSNPKLLSNLKILSGGKTQPSDFEIVNIFKNEMPNEAEKVLEYVKNEMVEELYKQRIIREVEEEEMWEPGYDPGPQMTTLDEIIREKLSDEEYTYFIKIISSEIKRFFEKNYKPYMSLIFDKGSDFLKNNIKLLSKMYNSEDPLRYVKINEDSWEYINDQIKEIEESYDPDYDPDYDPQVHLSDELFYIVMDFIPEYNDSSPDSEIGEIISEDSEFKYIMNIIDNMAKEIAEVINKIRNPESYWSVQKPAEDRQEVLEATLKRKFEGILRVADNNNISEEYINKLIEKYLN